MIADIDEIAEQNDPYGNVGTRPADGRKRRGGPVLNRPPKWKSQLRGLRSVKSRQAKIGGQSERGR